MINIMPHTSLSIPSPCSQPWDAMTPTAHGRHCAACAKVVVDFTRHTDAELLAWLHQQAGQPACGHFRADQLGRVLQPTVIPKPRSWRAWLATAVALWGLREATATMAKAQAPTEQRQREGEPISLADYVQKPVVIRGVVTESDSHEILPAVSVFLKGTNLGVATKADGHFELTIPADKWAASTKQLSVTFIGFEGKEISLPASPTQPLAVTLSPAITGHLGGVIVVNTARPWYTPRGLWQHLKRPFYR